MEAERERERTGNHFIPDLTGTISSISKFPAGIIKSISNNCSNYNLI